LNFVNSFLLVKVVVVNVLIVVVKVHKLAENIYGDWSEHVSSSGKRYYYNCKTEVSQWERPKDWPAETKYVPPAVVDIH